ncbi:MAG: terminase gpA endonuclease subunit, partial [Pseudomonadota bacterium]
SADKVHRWQIRHARVTRRECADWRRRKRLEKDPRKWLRWYLAGAYTRPFEKPHKEIVAGVMRAHDGGGRFIVAAERGIGKSALLWGMVLYLALSGRQRYPVCVPWAASALKRAFRFWKNSLCFNERIDADYPEYTAPFVHARGVSQRVMTTIWADTDEPTGAQLTVGAGIIVLPSGLGCIGGSTINGNVRGLNNPQEDGTVLRPTIALIDDVQDRKTAKSPVQVLDTIAMIDGDVAGIGEAGKDLPLLMAGTCTYPGDVMEHYLTDPEWHALRVSCIEQWPDGWDDDKSECRRLWEEWHERFLTDSKDAIFYRKHKKAMTHGMKLSAPEAFRSNAKLVDALYGAMRSYYRMGRESFMAERQQQPIDPVAEAGPYTLTQEVILSRTTDRPAWERPEWVTHVIASTDVNPSYALSTVVIGFGQDQSAAVLGYVLFTKAPLPIAGDVPAAELATQIYEALHRHGGEIAAFPVKPDAWYIDGRGSDVNAVVRLARESMHLWGMPALASLGYGARNYRPTGRHVDGHPREQCHRSIDQSVRPVRRWLSWNADYWREVAQRAWLGSIGAPGCCSLHKGGHTDFARQVASERLLGKAEVGGQMMWNWHTQPGRHDFGDAMAQAYAGAAYGGIGTGGSGLPRQPRRRRPTGVTVIPL